MSGKRGMRALRMLLGHQGAQMDCLAFILEGKCFNKVVVRGVLLLKILHNLPII